MRVRPHRPFASAPFEPERNCFGDGPQDLNRVDKSSGSWRLCCEAAVRSRTGGLDDLHLQARAAGRDTRRPADPPTLKAAVPNWSAGDTIPLGRDRMPRVLDVRPAKGDDDEPVLVVEQV
jgi:uncharacterized protein with von Willebrand factor type A (vWA) domain